MTQHKRECLSIVWAVLLLREYFKNTRFTIKTGYASLNWILNLMGSTGTVMSWRPRLPENESDVFHRKRFKHKAADALFSLQATIEVHTLFMDDFPIHAIGGTENDEGSNINFPICEEVSPSNAQSPPSDKKPKAKERWNFNKRVTVAVE